MEDHSITHDAYGCQPACTEKFSFCGVLIP